MKDYYKEIDSVLKSYETYKSYHTHSLEWVSNRITWCAKWKKLPENVIVELAERTTALFEMGLL